MKVALTTGTTTATTRYVNAYPRYRPIETEAFPSLGLDDYPDFGLAAARTAWGQQYSHLITDLGLDMIWQDMTCPAPRRQRRRWPQDVSPWIC